MTPTQTETFTCSKCDKVLDICYRSSNRGRRCKACVSAQQREYRRQRASIWRIWARFKAWFESHVLPPEKKGAKGR
jgi:hypothetical protein